MKYLFFDCEYATSRGGICKICEFGFIVTDDSFEIIDRGNFIINPSIERTEWDWRAVKKILTRKVYEYEREPSFYSYYNYIKEIIEGADLVFGHSLNQDAKAINDDSIRYDLPSIDYDFYDVKVFYKDYSGAKRDVGVVKMLDELNINGDENTHDAKADAYNTMIEFKAILDKLDVTVQEMIELCPNAKDKTENYIVDSIQKAKERREVEFKAILNREGSNDIKRHGTNRRRYIQFLDNVKPQKEGIKFKNKKISISINYEEHHYKQMLNLIQLITNEGGELILKGSLSNIFVRYDVYNEDGSLMVDNKYNYVLEANQNGSDIEVIDFSDLLDRLGITEDELNEMPIPSFEFLFDANAIIKDSKEKNRLQKVKNENNKANKMKNDKGQTLGDLFPDLFKKIKDEIDENK